VNYIQIHCGRFTLGLFEWHWLVPFHSCTFKSVFYSEFRDCRWFVIRRPRPWIFVRSFFALKWHRGMSDHLQNIFNWNEWKTRFIHLFIYNQLDSSWFHWAISSTRAEYVRYSPRPDLIRARHQLDSSWIQ
jgi:hypothetical protein